APAVPLFPYPTLFRSSGWSYCSSACRSGPDNFCIWFDADVQVVIHTRHQMLRQTRMIPMPKPHCPGSSMNSSIFSLCRLSFSQRSEEHTSELQSRVDL